MKNTSIIISVIALVVSIGGCAMMFANTESDPALAAIGCARYEMKKQGRDQFVFSDDVRHVSGNTYKVPFDNTTCTVEVLDAYRTQCNVVCR